jgi:hypothetical protein
VDVHEGAQRLDGRLGSSVDAETSVRMVADAHRAPDGEGKSSDVCMG